VDVCPSQKGDAFEGPGAARLDKGTFEGKAEHRKDLDRLCNKHRTQRDWDYDLLGYAGAGAGAGDADAGDAAAVAVAAVAAVAVGPWWSWLSRFFKWHVVAKNPSLRFVK